jgi:hypothetical protein
MYQGAFRIDRRVLDWKRWRISMLELEAVPIAEFYRKTNAIRVIGHGGPWGYETPRLPHFLDQRLTFAGEIISLVRGHPLPPGIFLSRPQGHSAVRKIRYLCCLQTCYIRIFNTDRFYVQRNVFCKAVYYNLKKRGLIFDPQWPNDEIQCSQLKFLEPAADMEQRIYGQTEAEHDLIIKGLLCEKNVQQNWDKRKTALAFEHTWSAVHWWQLRSICIEQTKQRPITQRLSNSWYVITGYVASSYIGRGIIAVITKAYRNIDYE